MSVLGRAVGAAGRRLRGRGPLVTVVLVAHGRSTFLDGCLASVRASTHRSLEVLLVAESGDGPAVRALDSLDISARRARKLPAGTTLEGAVGAATGEYLAFVDCDDVVPRDAYARMVEVLRRTGSDLAVGAQRHPRPGRNRKPSWTGELFDDQHLCQTVDSCPRALADLALTNKMFRLSFWRAQGLRVDSWDRSVATVARAYLAAAAFDVVPETVSEIHARDASLPIDEQARFDPKIVGARLDALGEVAAAVRQHGRPLWDGWSVDAFEHLLPPLYVDAVGGRERYFSLLSPMVRDLLTHSSPELLARVSAHPRITAWTAAHGSLTDVALMTDWLADNPNGLPTTESGAGRVVTLPEDLASRPPPELCRIEPVDRRLRVVVENLVHDATGVRLDGAAFVEYVEPTRRPDLTIVHPGGGTRRNLTVESRPDPALNEWAGRAWEDRADAGFSAFVDAVDLERRPCLEVSLDGLVETVAVQAPEAAAADRPVPDVRVDDATFDGRLLRMTGRTAARAFRVGLAGPRGAAEPARAEVIGPDFSVTLALTTTLFGEQVGLPAGRYHLEASAAGGRRLAAACSPRLLAHPPDLVSDRQRVTITASERGVTVVVGPPLRRHERGAFAQQRLASAAFGTVATSAYDRTVLLETFRGRSVGDNPGALGRELLSRDLGLDLVWAVDDPSVNIPDGTRAVARHSGEWYDVLARAHAYIGNAGAPYFFRKAPGQFHLQTWHGTPLKRIGEDRGPGDFKTWRHRRRMADQAAGWDAMISPSPYCSAIFRSAFGFEGRMLESGYPRNDILLGEGAAGVRERARRVLGVSEGERVVLYAPTWREYVGVRDAKPLYLDAPRLAKAMPDTVVLVRGHYNSTGQADVFAGHPRIHDVTRYPDIADLYLAADVLVTDYSSVMFDFVLTDKPVVLLTPDLEQYRDVERGFYFDIEERAPGPMVESTEQVIDVLGRQDEHSAARAAFRGAFCPYEDGSASRRVIDDLLARW